VNGWSIGLGLFDSTEVGTGLEPFRSGFRHNSQERRNPPLSPLSKEG
jgi:hypothetical protein